MNTGTQVPGTLSRNYIEQDLQAIVTHTLQLGYTDIVGTVSMFPIRGSLLLSLSLSLSLCVCVCVCVCVYVFLHTSSCLHFQQLHQGLFARRLPWGFWRPLCP